MKNIRFIKTYLAIKGFCFNPNSIGSMHKYNDQQGIHIINEITIAKYIIVFQKKIQKLLIESLKKIFNNCVDKFHQISTSPWELLT